MKPAPKKDLHEIITEGVRAAIASLYEEAKKNHWELVICENGKVKKIKPA